MSQHDQLIRRACDAALRNDTASLMEHLQCRNISRNVPSSLNSPLLNSTEQAQILHSRLFQEGSQPNDSQQVYVCDLPDGCRADHMLRALLMVPPIFESPWLAIFHFIKSIQSEGDHCERNHHFQSTIRSSLADIQSFLQQTVASWWENERRSNASKNVGPAPREKSKMNNSLNITPRDWFIRLTKKVIDPLVITSSNEEQSATQKNMEVSRPRSTNKNDHWMAPLELVATFVSLVHDFEHSLSREMLDNIFQRPDIRPDRLLPWLGLATDLHLFLSLSDWKMLLSTLRRKDTNQQYTAFLIQEDLPGLMTCIVTLASTLLDSGGDGGSGGGSRKKRSAGRRDTFKSWRMLALQLLYAASKDTSTFSTVAAVFQGGISALPSETLQEWVLAEGEDPSEEGIATSRNHCDNDSIPGWIRANLILVVMQAAQKSGSQLVTRFLSRALSRTGTHCDVALEGWKKLIGLASPINHSVGKKSIRGTSSRRPYIEYMERLFDGVSYVSNGCFRSDQESTASLLSQAGHLVYNTIFLGPASETNVTMGKASGSIYALERAQGWISAANNSLKSAQGILSPGHAVLFAVTLVIVFCEVPRSRSFVVRGMLQSIVGEADFIYSKKDIAVLHCLVIAAIVQSATDRPSNPCMDELKPIADVVAVGRLPNKIFFSLVKAIANSSEAADAAILSASRKRLQTSIGGIRWDNDTANESCDRIRCALYALCILSSSPKRNTCTIEAWKILSEIIVLNRPPLPLDARSWLFGMLRKLLVTNNYGSGASTRKLFRACLLRLLQFVTKNVSSGNFEVSSQAILTVWGGPDSQSVQSTLIEDMPELYRLLLALFFRIAESDGSMETTQVVAQGRRFMFGTCLRGRLHKQDSLSFSTLDVARPDLLLDLKLAIYLLSCAVGFAIECSSGTQREAFEQGRAPILPSVSSVRDALVSQEVAKFELLGLSKHDAEYLRPSWFEPSKGASKRQPTSSLSPPEAAIRNLALSFATILPILFEDHRWTLLVAPKKEQLLVVEHRELLICLQILSSCKQELSRDLVGKNDAGRFDAKISNTSVQTFIDSGTTLTSAVIVIEDVIAKKNGLSDISDILSVTLNKLTTLKSDLHDDSFAAANTDLTPTIYSIWQLYDCLCREDVAVRFIAYLEELAMPEEGKVPEAQCVLEVEGCRSLAIETPEDIDAVVRHVRLCVLESLRNVLILLVKHEEMALELFTYPPVLERACGLQKGNSFQWSSTVKSSPVDFLNRSLHRLASDLRSGLEGRSGGITSSIYQLYVESMDLISKLLLLFAEETKDLSVLLSIKRSCMASVLKIQDVLCSFPSNQKTLFQKIFDLCARCMPHTILCTTRSVLPLDISSDSGNAQTLKDGILEDTDEEPFAVTTFIHCVEKMKLWLGSGMPSGTTWEKILIPEHATDSCSRFDDDSSDHSLTPQKSDTTKTTGVPSVVTISHQQAANASGNEETVIQPRNNLELASKQMWTWVCSSALVALENIWLDSNNILRHRNAHHVSTVKFPLSSSSVKYMRLRTHQLLSSSRILGLALSHCKDEGTRCDPEKAKRGLTTTEFLAETMPTTVKVRLCALMDRMAAVLLMSVKLLDLYIRQASANLSAQTFVEALSSILAWSKCAELEGFSFTIQTRKWYTAEQRRMQSVRTVDFVAEDEILGHLTKLLLRIDNFESSSAKLLKVLRSCNKKSQASTEVPKRIQRIESVIRASDDKTDCLSFLSRVENELNKISEARSEFARANLNKAEDAPNSLLRIGKRKRRQQKELNRRMLRSRNQTVDEWLRSDQQVGREEGIDDDAYVDLEDFIVDG